MERIGIFVGSFDPFTIGHDSIVRRALPLFDRLVIGVGVNEKKHYMLTAEERVETIRGLYDGEKKISVEQYSDLTVDFAQRHGHRDRGVLRSARHGQRVVVGGQGTEELRKKRGFFSPEKTPQHLNITT